MSKAFAVVIGYGNSLRGDDGVGPHIATALQNAAIPGLLALAVPQLTPELAEPLAKARLVVFVDASIDPDQGVRVQPIEPGAAAEPLGHVASPRWLLGMARALHGHCPQAWLVSVPGICFDFGEGLSAEVRQRANEAMIMIMNLFQAAPDTRPIESPQLAERERQC
jgi:hydrogenase maturation protease